MAKSSASVTPVSGGELAVSDIGLRALLNGIFWWSILHIVHEHSVIELGVNNPAFYRPLLQISPRDATDLFTIWLLGNVALW